MKKGRDMMRFACLLWFMTLAAGCVLEDTLLDPQNDGGVDAGLCGSTTCPADQTVCTDELECVQCTADEDEYCTERSLTCDTDLFTCIECSDDQDCGDPNAARCDQNQCVPCTEDEQCDGIDDLGDAKNACFEGKCVDCTPDTEGDTCPSNTTCNPATRTCTDIEVGALDVCGECVADNQCGDGGEASDLHRCVEMFYDGNRYPNENAGYCLKVFSLGGCEQPYAIRISDRESLSGDPLESYCGIKETLTTCPAVRDLKENKSCAGGPCLEGGLCRVIEGLANRCTYLCDAPQQCLDAGTDPENPNAGSTCGPSGSGGAGGAGGAGGEWYCGGLMP